MLVTFLKVDTYYYLLVPYYNSLYSKRKRFYRVLQGRNKGFQPQARQHILNLCMYVCLSSERQEMIRSEIFPPILRKFFKRGSLKNQTR